MDVTRAQHPPRYQMTRAAFSSCGGTCAPAFGRGFCLLDECRRGLGHVERVSVRETACLYLSILNSLVEYSLCAYVLC